MNRRIQFQWDRPNAKSVLIRRSNCSFNWQRQVIAACRKEGKEYVNFTCLETLDEASARIEREEKEYYD